MSAPAEELVSDLRSQGIRLIAEDGELVLRGPRRLLTQELVGQVRSCKKEILAQLEDEHLDPSGRPKIARHDGPHGQLQLTLFGASDHPLLAKIRETQLDRMTPLDALQTIKAWQDELANDS